MPACASKQDVLELVTFWYVIYERNPTNLGGLFGM